MRAIPHATVPRVWSLGPSAATARHSIALVGGLHGDEYAGPLVLDLLRGLIPGFPVPELSSTRVLLIEGNPAALARFSRTSGPQAPDLNRLFGRDELLDSARRLGVDGGAEGTLGTHRLPASVLLGRLDGARPEFPEQLRSLQLLCLLSEVDLVLDLHSTTAPSEPFLIRRGRASADRCAAVLEVPIHTTGWLKPDILAGRVLSDCVDQKVAQELVDSGRCSADPVGLALETGQHLPRLIDGPGADLRAAWRQRLSDHRDEPEDRRVLDTWRRCSALLRWYERGCPAFQPASPPRTYTVVQRFQRSSREASFTRDFHNFTPVSQGEVVVRGGGIAWEVERDAVVVLPNHRAGLHEDFFFVAVPRERAHGRGAQLASSGRWPLPWARGVASEVAQGVDQFAHALEERLRSTNPTSLLVGGNPSGTQRILDNIGEMIGAATRRRDGVAPLVRVLGDGLDPSRHPPGTSQHYALAHARLLQSEIPYERVQFLRGCAPGWLYEMAHAILAREAVNPNFELYLSRRRSTGIQLVLIGDPDLDGGAFPICHAAILMSAGSDAGGDLQLCLLTSDSGLFRRCRRYFLAVRDHECEAAPVEGAEALRSAPRARSAPRSQWPYRDARGDQERFGALLAQLARWCAGSSGEGVDPLLDTPSPFLGAARSRPARIPHEVGPPEYESWFRWRVSLLERYFLGTGGAVGSGVGLLTDRTLIHARFAHLVEQSGALEPLQGRDPLLVIVGDGINLRADSPESHKHFASAHRTILAGPRGRRVGYSRVQLLEGATLRWLLSLEDLLRAHRGTPVDLSSLAGHPAEVNLVLVGHGDPLTPASIRIARLGLVISGVTLGSQPDQLERPLTIGIFADRPAASDAVNHHQLFEALERFCLSHVARMRALAQRAEGAPEAAVARMIEQLHESWCDTVHAIAPRLESRTPDACLRELVGALSQPDVEWAERLFAVPEERPALVRGASGWTSRLAEPAVRTELLADHRRRLR